MAWDQIKGAWKEVRGSVRERWGKLTDDDLDVIAGQRDQLIGTLQRRYGTTRDQVEREVADFEERLGDRFKGPEPARSRDRARASSN
jgi:uncharacterized protein YjbJ (UPF0337 family)